VADATRCPACLTELDQPECTPWCTTVITRARSYRVDPYVLYQCYWRGYCAICQRQLPRDVAVIDHDHETGAFRDVLCTACNSALGLFGDDPERLMVAARYLANHRKGLGPLTFGVRLPSARLDLPPRPLAGPSAVPDVDRTRAFAARMRAEAWPAEAGAPNLHAGAPESPAAGRRVPGEGGGAP
jgi:Recombination endonuclease VII